MGNKRDGLCTGILHGGWEIGKIYDVLAPRVSSLHLSAKIGPPSYFPATAIAVYNIGKYVVELKGMPTNI
jgi:hypothetical protein